MSSKDLQSVDLVLEFSHTSSVKDHIWEGGYRPSSTTEATYDWEFRVKDANNGDMKQYIEKVVINLHETFKNPKKTLKEPPFVVKEAGYAGFNIVVEFVFKGLDDKDKVKRTRVDYDLFLIPNLEDLSARNKSTLKKTNSHTCRKIITISHKDPKFIKSLIKGGGNLKSSPKALESSHHKSSTSKSSSGTTSSSSKSKSTSSSLTSGSSKSKSDSSSHHSSRYVFCIYTSDFKPFNGILMIMGIG